MAEARRLDVSVLKTWLWDAACEIRGPLDAPKFKDYILPLIFLKRLADVFDDEIGYCPTSFRHAMIIHALKLVSPSDGPAFRRQFQTPLTKEPTPVDMWVQ